MVFILGTYDKILSCVTGRMSYNLIYYFVTQQSDVF
jgi:hypothetical protein